jgi:hypothetical protein
MSTTASISKQYSHESMPGEASYNHIRSTLRKLKARSDLLKYSGGLLLWLASISLLMIGWLLLGGVLHLPVALRAPTILIWAGCAVWAGYVFIFKALIKRTSVELIAFRLEQRYPELQDRLISSLQLWSELPENKYGYAVSFIVRLVEEAGVLLDKVDRSTLLADDLRKFKRAGFAIACTFLPLVIIIALFPATFSDSLHTFAHPFERNEQLNPIVITGVIPGDCKILHGDSVDISADVKGPAPPEAALYYKAEAGEWHTMTLNKTQEAGGEAEEAVFAGKLQNVKESLKYYVNIADAQSQQYSITVIYKPIIDSLQLELHYPRYTRLPPQSLDANTGNVAAPLGTKVSVRATSSKDVTSAFVVFDVEHAASLFKDEAKARLETEDPRTLTGSFIVQRSGRYYISIMDTDGQSNSDPIIYSISVLADQPPQVKIVQPGEDTVIGDDMTLPLQVEARDDYGVAAMELYYQIEGQGEKQKISLGAYEDPQTSLSLSYNWDLTPLKLFPEDVVSYYVEAADADNISGPNIGRSAVFIARFPSLYELYEEIETQQQAQELEMEDIRSQQDNVKEMVDDLISELKREKELDWAGKKELERAAEMQKQIDEQVKDLAQNIDETIKKMDDNPLISPEALEKVQELRDLVDELATEEMKQIMRKLSEALEKINPSQQQRDLMEASFKQEEFMERLDRMIELFKNMQFRQKLEVALNQLEELVRQQTEIMEQSEQFTEKGVTDRESKSLADREERVQRQTEDLLTDLDKLGEEMQENIPDMADFIQQVADQAKQDRISDDFQCAISQLENSDPANSLPCQRKALSKLSQLQDSLQSAINAMSGQEMEEMMVALRDAIRSSLYLSHRHEEIMQANVDFKGTPEQMLPKEKEIMSSLAADEIDLAESVQKVAARLKELSHKTTAVSPELVWSLERVADGMRRSATAMEDKLPALVEPIQKNTLATLNRAIEDMLESMDSLNAQSMPMMGLDDYMQQLRQLAEQQSQLNQSTQGASNEMRKQGITPSLEDMLEKLAIEQSLIREAAERLSTKLDQLAEVLGNLEEVAREMREVEDSLRSNNLTGGVMEKQRRILTRLLEYEKSLKRQDFSKEREARAGRDFMVEQPESMLPADVRSPSAEKQWPAQYRELIKMYYKALSNTVK